VVKVSLSEEVLRVVFLSDIPLAGRGIVPDTIDIGRTAGDSSQAGIQCLAVTRPDPVGTVT